MRPASYHSRDLEVVFDSVIAVRLIWGPEEVWGQHRGDSHHRHWRDRQEQEPSRAGWGRPPICEGIEDLLGPGEVCGQRDESDGDQCDGGDLIQEAD